MTSLCEALKGIPIYIKSNGFVGELYSIDELLRSASYEIRYINYKTNMYCVESFTFQYMQNLGYEGLIQHILKDSYILETPLGRLVLG